MGYQSFRLLSDELLPFALLIRPINFQNDPRSHTPAFPSDVKSMILDGRQINSLTRSIANAFRRANDTQRLRDLGHLTEASDCLSHRILLHSRLLWGAKDQPSVKVWASRWSWGGKLVLGGLWVLSR